MRLSEWRQTPDGERLLSAKVGAALDRALDGLGAEADPVAMVAWGDDRATRYTVMAATDAGLAVVAVRVNIPGEGPRAAGRLVRWGRVQIADLTVETQGEHHHVSAQVEGSVLHGVDQEADRITEWLKHLYARIDDRLPK